MNKGLIRALRLLLNSNAKPVYGIGNKKIKGFTIYLPYNRYQEIKSILDEGIKENE